MGQEIKAEKKAVVEDFHGERSKKLLKCSAEATAHMRENFRLQQQRVANGEPVVLTYVGMPREIPVVMDILYTDVVHYSALCSAKQMSRYYLDKLNTEGYFRDLCRYCTVPLGVAFDHKPEIAPYGGIPKMSAVVTIHNDDPAQKIFELYARELDCPIYMIDYPYYSQPPRSERWWEEVREADAEIEQHRVDLLLEEFEGLIRFLETTTGHHFSITKLGEAMGWSNQMLEYYWKAIDLAAASKPAVISATDALSNVSAYVWFFGTEWSRDHARKFYEEVKERVDSGLVAVDNEKVRLLWGFDVPIWFNLGFYNTWEQSHGAVFLPINYLSGAERQIRRNLNDPLRTLASRVSAAWLDRCLITSSSRWFAYRGLKYKADGALFLMAESCKLLYCNVLFGKRALDEAGIPTLILNADMVDARDWDDTKMKALVTGFIETLMP